MPHLNVNGTNVHYRETGAGPLVVLLHGGGSSGAQWRRVCELLSGRYRTITVDHYGHGGTDPWPGAPKLHTHEAEAALVRAVMASPEAAGGEPAHLVGHSYGGGVALRLMAADGAGVRSLTLLEPIAMSLLASAGEQAMHDTYMNFTRAFLRRVDDGEPEAAWEAFLDHNNQPGTWGALPPEARERLLALTPAVVSGCHAFFNHGTTPAECAAIALPTLLLHGERTAPHFRRLTEIVAGHIPRARLAVIPEAGHMSPLTHPEAVAGLLASHLDAH